MEESVQKFLESLGKLNRAYLTALEEKLLGVLESDLIVECNNSTNNSFDESDRLGQ
ncbi:MAG: hypothetical protein V7K72_31015 [Nostoc sp.]|uniref:hypothetical protein n=1 Tax=Nostoc sp. TaxID=1180 RepID=UPI002FFAF49B